MERKEFQAESKRLLELMIHSIYTHKEIFLGRSCPTPPTPSTSCATAP